MISRSFPVWALAAGGIVLLAATLRLHRLGEADLWFDEAVMALAARGGWADVLAQTREHVATPILYPLVLSFVQQIAEPSALSVRLPSALFGIGAVAILAALPRAGVRPGVALAAALVLAIGSFQVFYVRETREYALSVLVSAGFVYALLMWQHARDTKRAAVICGLGVLAPFASYPSWFAALGSIAALLLSRNNRRVGIGALACFTAAACASYLLSARYQFGLAEAHFLDEHFLARSGMTPPVWLAMNAGAVFLYASPGLIAAPLIAGLFAAGLIIRRDVVSIAAAFAFAGIAVGGMLGVYAFGSPRHSIFLAPFLLVSAAGMGADLLTRVSAHRRPWAIGLVSLIVLSSAVVGFARVPLLASAHPAFARLAAFDIYGEREDIGGPLALARARPDMPLYVSASALPATRFHAPGLPLVAGAATDGPGMAREMAAAGQGAGLVAVFAHVAGGEDRRALAILRDACWRVLEDRAFASARFAEMRRGRC